MARRWPSHGEAMARPWPSHGQDMAWEAMIFWIAISRRGSRRGSRHGSRRSFFFIVAVHAVAETWHANQKKLVTLLYHSLELAYGNGPSRDCG